MRDKMISDTHSADHVSEYLHYGYRPSYVGREARSNWYDSLLNALSQVEQQAGESNTDTLAQRGLLVLDSVFHDLLAAENGLHVVPLSGGYDSRAILACLRRIVDRDKLVTVTFGTPGTYDFELGRQVAHAAGVRHEVIDLTQIQISRDLMLQTVQDGGEWTYLPDAFYNRLIYSRFDKDAVYWGGYAGETVAGSHALPHAVPEWQDARQIFAQSQQRVRNVRLASPLFDPVSVLPQQPLLLQGSISPYEQLDILVRQIACIRPIVDNGKANLIVPFAHPNWVSFMMGIPDSFRAGTALYKEIIKRLDPTLYSLPVKQNYGLPTRTPKSLVYVKRAWVAAKRRMSQYRRVDHLYVDPLLNYIDLNSAITLRPDVAQTVSESMERLSDSNIVPWLKPKELLRDHQSGRRQYGDALLLLMGLEVNVTVNGTFCHPRRTDTGSIKE
jgi:hypothetical protein